MTATLLLPGGNNVLLPGGELLLLPGGGESFDLAETAILDLVRSYGVLRRNRMIKLDPRIAGDVSLDTLLYWPLSDALGETSYLNATDYSSWQVECESVDPAVTTPGTWPVTSGSITAAVGSSTTPSLRIAWATANLGALTNGTWKFEVTGTDSDGHLIKRQFAMRILPDIG